MATAEAAGPGHVAPSQTQRPAPPGRCGDRAAAALNRELGSPESMGVTMESDDRRSQGAGPGGGGRGLPALGRATALSSSAFPAVGVLRGGPLQNGAGAGWVCWRIRMVMAAVLPEAEPTACPAVRARLAAAGIGAARVELGCSEPFGRLPTGSTARQRPPGG